MDSACRSFLNEVKRFVSHKRIYTDELRRLAWGTDAGFYRLVPKIVIRTETEEEVSRILQTASRYHLPVTFRAAGTSLSGQSVSDSILLVAGKNWEKYSVYDNGLSVKLQPGIIGSRVNEILAPFGREFGPDPASIKSCMVGGIVMNNASGMCCGTHANSDKALLSVRMVFADGTILDTGSADSRKAFCGTHPEFIGEIEKLRDSITADKKLSDRIRYKYSIKNVTGLNISPFVRYRDPFDIIAHLIVGSEGTLAFMSDVTMTTMPSAPFRASAMIYFADIKEAARAVVAMKPLNVSAAELLDKRSLASVDDKTGPDLTAVLTETKASSSKELQENIAAICSALEPFKTYVPFHFTDDPAEYSKYWNARSGIFPSVGGMRRKGTTCLIEDIAFHIKDLPEAVSDLSDLLDKHGYDDSCIYGHALEGNFHFIINQSFDSKKEVSRYESMISDVVAMVVGKYDGSLKAEHGTGRNMAPFVKYEWGEKAFSVMERVKKLFDPEGLLNPGVIFNDDPRCYLKNFKAMPALSLSGNERLNGIDKCIECGFCEVNCLSCGFTLSARTRIVAVREIERLKSLYINSKGTDRKDIRRKIGILEKEYSYYGDKTCATDGLCSMSCPMGINVADLTHAIRKNDISDNRMAIATAEFAYSHFSASKSLVRFLLRSASFGRVVLGSSFMAKLCRWLHETLGLPLWTPYTPESYSIPKNLGSSAVPSDAKLKVVYFPSCINQTMGLQAHAPVKKALAEETCELLEKAGYEVIFPEGMENLCCGSIWESKGMPDIATRKVTELEASLWKASCEGRYPVMCDQSPCLLRLRENTKRMKLYEPAEFIYTYLRDRLQFKRTGRPVAVHLTCSTRLMHADDVFLKLAKMCSSKVIVPEEIGCCGFAGDKGMINPELNKYALRKLSGQVCGCEAGYSNSRTCEIGLTLNSGIPYMSIVYLVNECTVSRENPAGE
ncbi:MAG: FAD-binding oxidoreductase [Bacteroidales bacterium]|jgi:D-lactate dehydrogenase|nr:FAD-binding oxidoreductase [Bacteroidales bacterium]MCI1786392.1 FAD-binding oxidoreductase [Bacteroidales bacterium]